MRISPSRKHIALCRPAFPGGFFFRTDMAKLNMLKPRVSSANVAQVSHVSETSRVRGSRWVAIRKSVMRRDKGLCQQCLSEGRVTLAEEVDHMTPLHAGGHATDESNLVSLCKECHKAKSDREDKERRGSRSV